MAIEDMPNGEWDSDEQLEFLKMERQVNPVEQLTDEGLTRKLLAQAAPLAAQRIINIAQHDPNSNTALRAAQFIVQSLLEGETGGKTNLEKLLAEVVSKDKLLAGHPDAE